ncbi:stage II sporulation protein M [Bacillus sp. FJAT-44742]|uniref:stage II sporulation protein M n=1 Tax=Bacillus sp. FJAT-44742 TaxID=2014005 RepID=UPI000C24A79C|nr:stage II sporulation protein M [Bacillus sp. FJAT-44742]
MKRKLARSAYQHIEEHRSLYLFVTVLFLMGIVFGAIVVNSLSLTQKHDLYMYLNQFFGQVSEGSYATASDMFKQSFSHYAKYAGLMWLLGLSVIGLPFILLLLFLKGIVVGFTVGFLVNQMGIPGFAMSFVSVLPQNLIVVPVYIFVAAISLAFSLKLIRHQFLKTNYEPIFPMFMKSCLYMGVSLMLLAFASSIEAFLSPSLMKIIIDWTAG